MPQPNPDTKKPDTTHEDAGSPASEQGADGSAPPSLTDAGTTASSPATDAGTLPPAKGGTSNGDAKATAEAAAVNVLVTNCGSCHGSQLAPQAAAAGMNYIGDFDQLVESGEIIPLHSAGSLIIERMRNGSMPPPDSNLPLVSAADIDTVAQFIDDPRFWPDYVPPACSVQNQLPTVDDVFRAIDVDLLTAAAQDAAFYRYISLTNRVNAGICADTALDVNRQALVKMMNMLSDDAKPGKVVSIDQNQTIFRIDLRDFNWQNPVVVNGQKFTDVWEATAANNPFNVQWVGDDANIAVATSQTNFPFQMSDMMMRNNTIGNVYYGIIGVDVNQTINDFILDVLQIDVNDDLLQRTQVRAGTAASRVSRATLLVQRDDLVLQPGALWQGFGSVADATETIFKDPFNFVATSTEAIFTRPNGMLGFLLADADGVLQSDTDVLLDTTQSDYRAVTSISCSNCHANGLIPVVDQVKTAVQSNPNIVPLTQDQVEQLQDTYVDPATFAKQITDDNTLYESSLNRVGLPIQGIDPVSSVWLQFDSNVTLNAAAGDLGLLPSALSEKLDLLNPALSALQTGSIRREDFTALYIDSLCIVSASLSNVPLQDTCAQAHAAVQALNGGI